eukprot:1630857-Prymnesium_polylepis.1
MARVFPRTVRMQGNHAALSTWSRARQRLPEHRKYRYVSRANGARWVLVIDFGPSATSGEI